MSILNVVSQGALIAAGLRANARAKKGDSQRPKRSTASPRREPALAVDQVKKDAAAAEQGLAPNPPQPTRTSFRSAARTPADGPDRTDAGETNELLVADRGAVLNACFGTSAGLSLSGFLLRQASHSAAEGGWNLPDVTTLMPFRPELWQAIPTVFVFMLVTSLRHILLQVWPDFVQSSRVANNQVLRSLQPVDIFTVSFLSGTSEELLFRGALLPFLGPDWRGVLGAGLIFGVLHVSGGRNASFAIWASFVGVLYGILGLYTYDLAAPMAAHSVANLLGAIIWKVSQNDEETKSAD